MKIIIKVTALLSLVLFSSCNTPTPQPGLRATDMMETSMAIVKTEIVGTLTAVPTSTSPFLPATPSPIPVKQTPDLSPPFDRHDPEAVLRAYFDAWDRQDWVAQESLLPTNGIRLAHEPANFVHIIELTNLTSSPIEYVYQVRYEIGINGQGSSTQNRKYVMKYYLIWDPTRDTWCISGWGYP